MAITEHPPTGRKPQPTPGGTRDDVRPVTGRSRDLVIFADKAIFQFAKHWLAVLGCWAVLAAVAVAQPPHKALIVDGHILRASARPGSQSLHGRQDLVWLKDTGHLWCCRWNPRGRIDWNRPEEQISQEEHCYRHEATQAGFYNHDRSLSQGAGGTSPGVNGIGASSLVLVRQRCGGEKPADIACHKDTLRIALAARDPCSLHICG